MQEDWRARCVSLLALHVRREAHLAEAHGGATFPADLAVPAALSAGLQAEAAQQAAAASGGGGGGNSVANSATLASGAKQDGDDVDGDVLGSAENPLQRSWFFGKIERDEAEAILAECTGVDALMIRVSTMLGYFALSTVKWGGGGGGANSNSNKSFTHVLIAPKGQAPHVQYVLENSRDTRAYPNVAAVVAQSPLCAGLAPAGSHTTRRAADPAAMHVPEAMPTASTGRNAVASKRNMRATAKAVAAGGSSSSAAAAVPTSGAATAASLGLAGTGPVAGGGSGMQDDGDATYGKAPPPPKAATAAGAAMGRPLGAPPPLANPAMAGDGDATYGKAPPPPKAAAAMGRPLGVPPPLANPAMAGDGDATYGKAPPPPKAAAAAPGAGGGLPPPPSIDDQDEQYGKAPKPPGATGATGAAAPPSPAPGSNFGAPGGVKLVTPGGGGGGAGGGLPPPPSIDDQDQQYGKAPKPPGPGGAAPTSAAPAPGSNFGAPGGVKLVTPGGGGAAPTVAGSAGTADDQDQQYGKAPKPPGAPGGAPAAAATPPPPASMGPPAGSPPPLLGTGGGAAAGGGGGGAVASGAGAAPGLTVGEASMSQRDALEALLAGERDFSTAMSVFARQYVTPLTSEAQSKGKKATLPAADVKALFANAGEIATLSADLLRQLEQRQQAGGDTYNVGDLLEQMSSRMACFAAYGAASCTSRVTYLKLTNKGSGMNKAFIDWERRVTNIAETMFTPCDDFLTKPLQRIVQYCPIIRDLIAHTQQGTPEYNSLTTALDKIEQIASYATSRRQLDLNLRELQRVKAHVTGWPSGFDLAIPTRGLVAKMVAKRHVKKKTEDFKLWLFTDVLLLSLVGKKNSFKLRGRIYLDKLRVMDVSGTAAQHCLDIMDRDDEKNKMTFSMTSAEDKVAFLAAVKTATRDHMMGDRESRVRPFLEPFEFRAPGQPRPRALSNGSSSSAGAGAAGSGGSGTGTPGGGIFGAGSAGGSRGTIGRGGNASSVGTIGRGGSSGGLGSISGTPTGGGSGSQSPSAAAAGGGSSGSLGPPPPISTPGAAAPAGLPPPPEEDEGLYSFTPNSQRPGGGSTMPVPKMPAGPGGGAPGAATVGGGDTYGSLAKGVPGLPPPPPAAGGPTAGGAENYGSMISPKAPAQPPPATYGAAPHVPRPVVGTTPAAAGPPPAPIVGGAPAMPAEDTYGKMTAPPGAPTASGGAAPPPPAAGAAAGAGAPPPGGGLPPPPALSGGAESYGKMPTVVGGAGAGGAPPVPMSAPPPGALSVPSAATTALPGSQYYTYEQLTNPASRPANLDQTRLERYLSPAEFQTVFGMSQSDFAASPTWKQAQLKTQKKL